MIDYTILFLSDSARPAGTSTIWGVFPSALTTWIVSASCFLYLYDPLLSTEKAWSMSSIKSRELMFFFLETKFLALIIGCGWIFFEKIAIAGNSFGLVIEIGIAFVFFVLLNRELGDNELPASGM